MSAFTRRTLFAGTAAVATIGAIPAAAVCAAASPDAELIRLCNQHVINLHTYNTSLSALEPEDDPLWAAYSDTYAAVTAARPQTVEGMVAVARAAKAEALQRDGREVPENGPAARWAWQLLNDLLRLQGSVGG